MGYYLRYFLTDGEKISLQMLEAGLRQADVAYSIRPVGVQESLEGELLHGTDLCGLVEINQPAIEEELDEMREGVEEIDGPEAQMVLDLLNRTRAAVVVQVLYQGRTAKATLEKIDPLWEWLDANREGLLQCDGEGYYRRGELLLETG